MEIKALDVPWLKNHACSKPAKTSAHFVDVAAALQWDHMSIFSERTLIWVLAGHARFIFLLLSHLFPSLPSHLSAHQSAGSVARTAHGVDLEMSWQRYAHDARIETAFCRRTLWSWSGHIIQLVHLWKIHLWQTPQDVFFFVFFPDPFLDESQTASSLRR